MTAGRGEVRASLRSGRSQPNSRWLLVRRPPIHGRTPRPRPPSACARRRLPRPPSPRSGSPRHRPGLPAERPATRPAPRRPPASRTPGPRPDVRGGRPRPPRVTPGRTGPCLRGAGDRRRPARRRRRRARGRDARARSRTDACPACRRPARRPRPARRRRQVRSRSGCCRRGRPGRCGRRAPGARRRRRRCRSVPLAMRVPRCRSPGPRRSHRRAGRARTAGSEPRRRGPPGAGAPDRLRRWTRRPRPRPSSGRACSPRSTAGPRRATSRRVSPGHRLPRSPTTTRPSALLTTLLVTHTTSPSASRPRQRGKQVVGEVVAAAYLSDAVGRARRDHATRATPQRPPSPLWPRVRSSGAARPRTGARPRERPPPRRHRRCRRASRRAPRPSSGHRSARRRPRGHLDADRREQLVGHSAYVACRRRWGRGRRPARGWRPVPLGRPGTPRIVPTLTTGLLGGTSTRSASAMASSTPGPGNGVLETDDDDGLGRHLGAQPHPILLEVHDPAAARCCQGPRSRCGSRRGRRSSGAT